MSFKSHLKARGKGHGVKEIERVMGGKNYRFVKRYGDESPAEKKAEKLHKEGYSVRIIDGFVEEGLGVFSHPAFKYSVWIRETPKGEKPTLEYSLTSRKRIRLLRFRNEQEFEIAKIRKEKMERHLPRITPKTPRLRR